MTVTDGVVAAGCGNLRQGDIVDHPTLSFADGSSADLGIAILSQTCDVVQESKTRCLVAPVISSDDNVLRSARKGRKPLHLFLAPENGTDPQPCVVDMEQAKSVLKSELEGKPIKAQFAAVASGAHAAQIGARVGRAFNRFPFPDEVYPFFEKLRARVQSKAGTPSVFGQVIDLVDDLRVGADQWVSPARELKLYVVVAMELLLPREDFDPGWVWGIERVEGVKAGETLSSLSLNRVCELILANLGRDTTASSMLWAQFGECLVNELLTPNLNSEVGSCRAEVLSDIEMTYRQYQRTESLDLEVLSGPARS